MAKGGSASQANTLVARGGSSGSAANAPPTAAGLRKRSSENLEAETFKFFCTFSIQAWAYWNNIFSIRKDCNHRVSLLYQWIVDSGKAVSTKIPIIMCEVLEGI